MCAITEEEQPGKEDFGHSYCLLCGDRNPWSRRLIFKASDSISVFAEFQACPELQGYEGFLHGGVISALLDAAMTHCLFHMRIRAVTADLNIRFRAPTPCRAKLLVRASMSSSRAPLFRMTAELIYDGRLMAEARAKFMQLRPAVPGKKDIKQTIRIQL
jgi:acyl-coenzyme A thioesterase PaaI-like protein